jgi:hypothetical protein
MTQLASSSYEEALEQNEIRAITAFRAKPADRMETKIGQQQKEKRQKGEMEYKGGRNIYADTVDFSGMRISLYFSNDRIKV